MKSNNPQFKELRFKTEAEFNSWLKKETYMTIDFKGQQDLQRVHLHVTGEILHCNLQASIWNGRFILINAAKNNSTVMMSDPYNKNEFTEMSFIVEKLTFA